jgi:hypothetical protein
MKRPLLIVMGVMLLAAGAIVVYTFPRHVAVSLTGVKYALGTEPNQVVPVAIQIHGTVRKSLTGSQTFQGTVGVLGASVPNPDNDRPVEIRFDANGGGYIVYGYDEHGSPVTRAYGVLFTNNNFSKLTIGEFRPGTGWAAANGLTISAPADDRAQAVKISSELMKRFLNGYALK